MRQTIDQNINQQNRQPMNQTSYSSIRAPENVNAILSRIKNIHQEINVNTTETQEESTVNNSRLVSESTFSDARKKGKKSTKPAKSAIFIDTL